MSTTFPFDLLNRKKTEQVNDSVQTDTLESPKAIERSITLSDYGFERARAHSGNPSGLQTCLFELYESFREMARKDTERQNRLKEPYHEQLTEEESKLEALEEEKEDLVGRRIPRVQSLIEKTKEERRKLLRDKDQNAGDRVYRFLTWFVGSLTVISFMSVWIFYASSIYSAVFKTFNPNDGFMQAVFDPAVFGKAIEEGIGAVLLILLAPAAFIGLGILSHFGDEDGNSWQARLGRVGLTLLGLAVDVLLAFHISEKLYDLKRLNTFQTMDEYSFGLAIKNSEFWIIIALGFVIYFIAGLLFSFTIKCYRKADTTGLEIKGCDREIEEFKKEEMGLEQKRDELEEKIREAKAQIHQLKKKLEHTFIILPREFENQLWEFMDGWQEWMKANRLSQTKIEEASLIAKDNINQWAGTAIN